MLWYLASIALRNKYYRVIHTYEGKIGILSLLAGLAGEFLVNNYLWHLQKKVMFSLVDLYMCTYINTVFFFCALNFT